MKYLQTTGSKCSGACLEGMRMVGGLGTPEGHFPGLLPLVLLELAAPAGFLPPGVPTPPE